MDCLDFEVLIKSLCTVQMKFTFQRQELGINIRVDEKSLLDTDVSYYPPSCPNIRTPGMFKNCQNLTRESALRNKNISYEINK
jgi:hypothetical protein